MGFGNDDYMDRLEDDNRNLRAAIERCLQREKELKEINERLIVITETQNDKIERKDEALKDALITMHHARVFVNSRQRIRRPEGIDQYDECIDKVAQALKDGE